MARRPTHGQQTGFLNGKLLIAMPSLLDPNFEKTVILLCHHTPETAMGLVLSRVMPQVTFRQVLNQLNVDGTAGRDLAVHWGGPVESARGFVLHSNDYHSADSDLGICEGVDLTASVDILRLLGAGGGPARAFFALGYAGWGAGQLEQELHENAWLTSEPDAALIFDIAPEAKWAAALSRLGVDPAFMPSVSGRA